MVQQDGNHQDRDRQKECDYISCKETCGDRRSVVLITSLSPDLDRLVACGDKGMLLTPVRDEKTRARGDESEDYDNRSQPAQCRILFHGYSFILPERKPSGARLKHRRQPSG